MEIEEGRDKIFAAVLGLTGLVLVGGVIFKDKIPPESVNTIAGVAVMGYLYIVGSILTNNAPKDK